MAWGGPRLIRAYGALQWARYHAAQPPDATGQHARALARWAQTALTEAAPLPWGAAAARAALDYGAREEAANPKAAQALYERLQATLEGLTASRWRGLGLGELLAETRNRRESLRARTESSAP